MKKKINILQQVAQLVSKGGMVRGFFSSQQEVFTLLRQRKLEKRPVRILNGETYDLLGITIDSLKYYLFLSLLHQELEKAGIVVESVVVIADTASIINTSSGDTPTILKEGERRLKQVNKIIHIYNLPIRAQLMSEIFTQNDVRELIGDVQNIVIASPEIQMMLAKTVLQNRIRQEDKTAYRYGAEAVATALLFDLKIGPPRERYYDEAAAAIARKLKRECYVSLYLTPTYPLGLDFTYFLLHPEIEEFGLTPYKAGSNKLESNRIVLGRTSLDRVYDLINTSFIPKQLGLPDPIGDLRVIANIAGYFLRTNSFDTQISTDKAIVKNLYAENIYKKFEEENI